MYGYANWPARCARNRPRENSYFAKSPSRDLLGIRQLRDRNESRQRRNNDRRKSQSPSATQRNVGAVVNLERLLNCPGKVGVRVVVPALAIVGSHDRTSKYCFCDESSGAPLPRWLSRMPVLRRLLSHRDNNTFRRNRRRRASNLWAGCEMATGCQMHRARKDHSRMTVSLSGAKIAHVRIRSNTCLVDLLDHWGTNHEQNSDSPFRRSLERTTCRSI